MLDVLVLRLPQCQQGCSFSIYNYGFTGVTKFIFDANSISFFYVFFVFCFKWRKQNQHALFLKTCLSGSQSLRLINITMLVLPMLPIVGTIENLNKIFIFLKVKTIYFND